MTGSQTNGVNGAHVNGHHDPATLPSLQVPTRDRSARSSHSDDSQESSPSPKSSTSRASFGRSRKPSQPLAPPFLVSAPGKTIVYGEHAVVHGKAAIAAAISLRTYLLVTTLTKSQRTVSLKFVDIELDHTWNIQDLPWKEFAHPARKKRYYDMITERDEELIAAMQPHLVTVSCNATPEKQKMHRAAASAFLYLFMSLGSQHSMGCIYAMRSTVPVGVGLGSSASVCVCIAAALLVQARALSGPHPDQQGEEAAEQLERINRWAFVGEMGIHGNPSGVDNTVATHGHAVFFERTDYTKPPLVKVMNDFPELPLLLLDTCVPKSTAAEVAKVALLKKTHPTVADGILNSIDAITRSVYERISSGDFDPTSNESIEHLGQLMSINHALLSSLGVSHPRLDRLRYLVDQAGVGWTKLTGAGGGGCAITLLRPDELMKQAPRNVTSGNAATLGVTNDSDSGALTPSSSLLALEKQLEDEGFKQYKTTLGGDGVGVLYPALINDEEIDLEMFLTVEGREGVEQLVGVSEDEGAWKFWRP
jgi:mevalonate kinase